METPNIENLGKYETFINLCLQPSSHTEWMGPKRS